MKLIVGAVVAALFGVPALVEGIRELLGPVTCAGRVLSPGDTCTTYSSRRSGYQPTVLDYESYAAQFRTVAAVKVGIGLLITLLAVLFLVAVLRHRKSTSPGPAEPRSYAPQPHGPQPYTPQPYTPQPHAPQPHRPGRAGYPAAQGFGPPAPGWPPPGPPPAGFGPPVSGRPRS